MFGGLVGFSYCCHFVLITVVWMYSANCLPPISQMTLSLHLNIVWIFEVFKISLPALSHWGFYGIERGVCVYCIGSQTWWEEKWGGWRLRGSLGVVVPFFLDVSCLWTSVRAFYNAYERECMHTKTLKCGTYMFVCMHTHSYTCLRGPLWPSHRWQSMQTTCTYNKESRAKVQSHVLELS